MAKYPCIKCDQNVGSNTDAIQCSCCDLWQHKACGIDEDIWKLVTATQKNQGDSAATWLCKVCICVKKKFMADLTSLTARFELQESRMDVQENKLLIQENKLLNLEKINKDKEEENQQLIKQNTDLQKTVEDLKKQVSDYKEVTAKAEDLNIKTVMDELSDQETRKFNLICHNVPESTSHDSEFRKQHDLQFSENMINHMGLPIGGRNIATIKRLGRRTNANPRPMMIVFYDAALRDEILARKSCLSQAEGNWKVIRLSPDLTLRQREHDQAVIENVIKKNNDRNEQEMLNFQFRAVGQKGRKKIIKTSVTPEGRAYPTLRSHIDPVLQEREENLSQGREVDRVQEENRRGHGFSTQTLEDY